MQVDAAAVAYEAIPKAVHYVALAVAIGTIVARGLLGRGSISLPVTADARLSTLIAVASAGLLLSLLLRLAGHAAAAFGPADAWTAENLGLIALESRWGASWRLQAAAAAALLVAAIVVRVRGGRAWQAAAVAALACCAATPLLGHAAGSVWRGTIHALHILGGGAWLGTLIAIVLLDWMMGGNGMGDDARRGGEDVTGGLVERFSPVALTAAAVVSATGLAAAATYLATAAALVGTPYGLALVVKLALVLGILACGYANWRRARAGEAPRMPLLRTEAALAVLVLVVTSVLTELEHP